MNKIIKIFLAVFAIYKLAGLISSEEGPYLSFLYKDPDQSGVFEWFRKRIGAYNYIYEYDERGNQRIKVATNLGRGISCPLCTAAYISFPIALLVNFPKKITDIPFMLLTWLGLWGAQSFLENLTSDDALEDAIKDVAESTEQNEK